jgi:hypothetical protein
MNVSMNYKKRSKLLLQLRRRKRKSLLSKYGQRMRDDHEGAISPLFFYRLLACCHTKFSIKKALIERARNII